MIFQIRIAEKNIRIHSLHEKVRQLCIDYLNNDKNYDFEIIISIEDIVFERNNCLKNRKGVEENVLYSDDYLETLAVYRKISTKFLEYDTFLMHGSVVSVDNRSYLFLAPSGTGKTTHTQLWLDNVPGAYIVNGDKPLIMIKGGNIYTCGTPWCGKEGLNANSIVQLEAIYLLERAKNNMIREISFLEAFPFILRQTYQPKDPLAMKKTLNLIKLMNRKIKCFDLKCNISREAALMAYNKNHNI